MEKKKINKNKTIIMLILIVIVLIIGTSYAWFIISKTSNTKNIITAGKLSLLLTKDNSINLLGAYPEKESAGLKEKPFTFKIENDGNIVSKYTIIFR